MTAFVISLNGQPFVTAGVGDDGTVPTNIAWIGCSPPIFAEGSLGLFVHGIDARSGECVRWSVPEIGVGDEISINIIQTNQASPQDERFRVELGRCRPEKDRAQRIIELNCRPGLRRGEAKSGELSQEPLQGESGHGA
jgi:hypothetical protein